MRRQIVTLPQKNPVGDALSVAYEAASPAFADQHWTTLCWARLALSLGARKSVVERLTGIDHAELLRNFSGPKAKRESRKSAGRAPQSSAWFVNANLIVRVQAAEFYAIFDKLRSAGNRPAESLIKGYEKFSQRHSYDLRLSFDRAYHLTSLVDGLWSSAKPELRLAVCGSCQSIFIAGRTATSGDDCAMCLVNKKFYRSRRVSGPLTPPNLAAIFHAHTR
jgi:hypothetical protein